MLEIYQNKGELGLIICLMILSLLLEGAPGSYLEGERDLALDQITETLLSISEAVDNFVIMSWELTATSTPEK